MAAETGSAWGTGKKMDGKKMGRMTELLGVRARGLDTGEVVSSCRNCVCIVLCAFLAIGSSHAVG
jgi:hypothetical protein